MSRILFPITAATLAAFLITGCNKNATVKVEYEQLANFHDYRTAPDSSGSFGAGGMFILYRINKITNAGPEAKTFAFDVNKVVTATADKTSNETVNTGNMLLGPLNLTTVTVQPGETKVVSRCFIKDALTSDPKKLVSTTGFVGTLYQLDDNQPVNMVKAPGNKDIVLVSNALPNALQGLCKDQIGG